MSCWLTGQGLCQLIGILRSMAESAGMLVTVLRDPDYPKPTVNNI